MKTIRLLLLLALAARVSAATITVTGSGDNISGDLTCTLREAITAANTNAVFSDCPGGTPGLDQIHFAVGAPGPQTILLFSPLPDIVDPVTIDGTTQPGFAGTPLIRVAATYIVIEPTFRVTQAAGGSTFRGLLVTNAEPAAAIELRSNGNLVVGNYLNMTDGSTPMNSGSIGVLMFAPSAVSASNNTIGGAAAADRNVFGGNGTGVAITAVGGGVAIGNAIAGNYFGWNATKTAAVSSLSNAISLIGATNTVIIGNSIVGSSGNAISITLSTGTVVQSNEIGTFAAANGNGIFISASDNSIIGAATSGGAGGNVLLNNGTSPDTAGVVVLTGTGNRISGNSMSFNGSGGTFLGIDLFPYGSTPNDACDPDAGANLLQNKPVVTSAVHSGGMVTIEGTLNSGPSNYTIDVYGNPPAAFDQGYQYLGSISVTTDASCQASFSGTFAYVPAFGGATITATAIDTSNNTSEMSAPAFIIDALDAPVVTKAFNPPSVPIGEPSTLTVTLTNTNASAITGVDFIDDYPPGLNNAGDPNVTNTCGGTVTAVPGANGFTFSGGTIPANASCSISVSVVSFVQGSYVNQLPAGAVTSANAEPSDAAATATLTVGAATSDVPLSPAALMLLAAMLAMAGVMAMRR